MNKALRYILLFLNGLLLASFIYNDWASGWVLNQPLYAFVLGYWFQLLVVAFGIFNFLFGLFNPHSFIGLYSKLAPKQYREAVHGDLLEILTEMESESMHPILISFIINWHVYSTISSIQRSRISDLYPGRKPLK